MAKKRRRFISKRVQKQDSNDVSVNDFANAATTHGGGRLKKNKVQSVVCKTKELRITEVRDIPWYEKEEEGSETEKKKRERKKTGETDCEEEEIGDGAHVQYPIDVWYLISEHIAPEDVGRFAGICRDSNSVVQSAKFWFSMYKRFYRPVENLPVILQPTCMVRRYGLRSLVIRSLYYFYRPFRNTLTNTANSDPEKVVGRHCVVAWSQKIKGRDHWIYNFKLKLPESNVHGRRNAKPKPDLWEMLSDIHANVDDDCKILQVKSNSYHPLPMLSGQTLLDSKLKMSADCGSYNLHLQFGCGRSNYQSSTVSIGNVSSIRELDWWHPTFTHSESLHGGLFSSSLLQDSTFTLLTANE